MMNTISKKELAAQVVALSSLTGKFTLRSGQISDVYFDKYRFEGNPTILKSLAQHMAELVPFDTEIIAGLELGGVPLATAISLETGIPTAFIRKEAKAYGTCRAIEGQDIAGKKVTFIEDVISTGGAVSDALNLALKEGADVRCVVCAIWRGEGRPRIEKASELEVFPLFEKADLFAG